MTSPYRESTEKPKPRFRTVVLTADAAKDWPDSEETAFMPDLAAFANTLEPDEHVVLVHQKVAYVRQSGPRAALTSPLNKRLLGLEVLIERRAPPEVCVRYIEREPLVYSGDPNCPYPGHP